VLAVSVDPPEVSARLAKAKGLTFPLLSDTEGLALDAFGVRHAEGSPYSGDVARPATFIFDRDGKVVWRLLTDNWRIRTRPEPVIDELRRIP
jgi:peroxiredoxin